MTKIRVFLLLITIVFLLIGGGLVILYAKGYRINREDLSVTPQGILVANSEPNGAQVIINGELKTATNNTLSLTPGTYDVIIRKEGYQNWEKRITIKKEEVTQIFAFLVPSVPSLTPLTFAGVSNPIMSDDLSKIAYIILPHEDNGEKAGLWVMETANFPLGFSREPKQITDGNLTDAEIIWSPDGRQIMLKIGAAYFVLDTSAFTPQERRINIASQAQEIMAEWEEKKKRRLEGQLNSVPEEFKRILSNDAYNIRFSPDETKILYTAKRSVKIPEELIKPIPGSSTQKEARLLEPDKTYVYDIKEDKNFLVGDEGEVLYWLPNSLNLLAPEEGRITIIDYDGTNKKSIFSGSYLYPFAFPSSSMDKIIFLTNLGAEDVPQNLYWLSLR